MTSNLYNQRIFLGVFSRIEIKIKSRNNVVAHPLIIDIWLYSEFTNQIQTCVKWQSPHTCHNQFKMPLGKSPSKMSDILVGFYSFLAEVWSFFLKIYTDCYYGLSVISCTLSKGGCQAECVTVKLKLHFKTRFQVWWFCVDCSLC